MDAAVLEVAVEVVVDSAEAIAHRLRTWVVEGAAVATARRHSHPAETEATAEATVDVEAAAVATTLIDRPHPGRFHHSQHGRRQETDEIPSWNLLPIPPRLDEAGRSDVRRLSTSERKSFRGCGRQDA